MSALRLKFAIRTEKMLYEHLTALGFECLKPQGAFYLFVKSPIEDYAAFVEEGKKQHLLDGGCLKFWMPGLCVRLAYCVSPEMIKRSFPAFERLAEHARQCDRGRGDRDESMAG